MARVQWGSWKEAVGAAIGLLTLGGLVIRPVWRELIRPFFDRRIMSVVERCRPKLREIIEVEFKPEIEENRSSHETAMANKDSLAAMEASLLQQGKELAAALSLARTLEPLPNTLEKLDETLSAVGREVSQMKGSMQVLEKFIQPRGEDRREHSEPVDVERRSGIDRRRKRTDE